MKDVLKMMQNLRHMLGADSRYKKKDWGFRNHYAANESDTQEMDDLVEHGLAIKGGTRDGLCFYHATEDGARAIGFTEPQIKKHFNPKILRAES